MATLNEYAQLSAVVYAKTPANTLPVPTGWQQLTWQSDTLSGFSAGAYKKGSEIVISYTGTNGSLAGDFVWANIPAGAGLPSAQVLSAIEFYFNVRDANPGATISFTGHSLGGGLASLMAIYFNKSATTFAPAPFMLSAINMATLGSYQAAMLALGRSDAAFDAYTPNPTALYESRQTNVEAHTIQGEILLDLLGRGGTIVDPAMDFFYDAGSTVPPVTLHSILLHAAVIRSPEFKLAVTNVQSVLPMINDESMYATAPESSNVRDFMSKVMQAEWNWAGLGAHTPLRRFADDLLMLAPTGAGLAQTTDVQKALVVAAMEYRYFKDAANATQLFTSTGNAIHFKYSDIGASEYKSLPLLALATGAQFGVSDKLKKQDAWHIQSGAGAMAWAATGADNDAVIGGTGGDYADAGAGNDILIGNEGNDQLSGGAGNDILIGGSGNDTLQGGAGYDVYYWKSGAGFDQLRDSGDGRIVIQENNSSRMSAGAYRETKKGSGIYTCNGFKLINGPSGWILQTPGGGNLDLGSFSSGDYGMFLKQPDPPPSKPWDGGKKAVSPIILDLDGDGIETVSIESGAYFDHDGNGFAEKSGWVGVDDGLLARDLNGNGQIDSGVELFGSDSILSDNNKAAHGFLALAELDSNGDGRIDAGDTAFASLRVWKDSDGNGTSRPDELLTLEQAGVASISLNNTTSTTTLPNGNQQRQVGSYSTLNGETRSAVDIWFKTDPTFSVPTSALDVPADINALPEMQGYGNLYDLRQAMVRDPVLKALVIQFMQTVSASDRESVAQAIVYRWTGADQHATDSRGSFIDARTLFAMEAYFGEQFLQYGYSPNPGPRAAGQVESAFGMLVEMVYSTLSSQSHLKPLFDLVDYVYDDGSGSVLGDLARVADKITMLIIDNRGAGKELLSEFVRVLRGLGQTGTMDLPGLRDLLSPLGVDVTSIIDGSWALVGTDRNDSLVGTEGGDMIQGLAGDDSLTGIAGNDVLDGGSGNDILYGNDGSDYLSGGTGTDKLYGGAGLDKYYFGRGDGQDTIYEDYLDDTWIYIGGFSLSELTFRRTGTDLIVGFASSAGDSISLANFFKNGEPATDLVLRKENGEVQTLDAGTLLQITLAPTNNADVLEGGSLPDTINALGGDDLVFSRGGNDVVDGGSGNDSLNGGDGDDQIVGGVGNDALYGDAGRDTLNGGDGNDSLDGGIGADSMTGGLGDDTFAVDDPGDVVIEAAGGGMDSVLSSITLTLSANVENATLTGSANVNATGNSDSNSLVGNQGANKMYGMAGNDTLKGEAGDDTLDGGDGLDILHGGAGADALSGGNQDDKLFGESGNDRLYGNEGNDFLEGGDGQDTLDGGNGNDFLDGGLGVDNMAGGGGDDAYIVDETGDIVVELAGGGYDTIYSAVSYAMPENFESLVLAGSNNLELTGNAQANSLLGNAGNNRIQGLGGNDTLNGAAGNDTLEGGAGNDILDGCEDADTLIGGVGDDTYHVDQPDDVVTELAGEGLDTVIAKSSFTLTANVENLVLDTEAGYAEGIGNALANRLTGNEWDNRLDGGAGADIMEGGQGNDTYVVDHAGDQVIEALDAGWDTVEVGFSYTLGAHLENLTLTGTGNINGTGNALHNQLVGNVGNNILDGGLGADGMAGGAGNDTYRTDEQGDRIEEYDGEGIDTEIRGYETLYGLARGVENLTLTGTVYRGNGNDLDNVITGNEADNNLWGMEGNDTLIGGGGDDAMFGDVGQDTMIGGLGDDYYEVDDAGDVLIEEADAGYEMVRATVSFTLGANLERLAVDGEDDLSATGNAMDNGLWGNIGNNVLTGGLGNDYLEGGEGDDVYVFNRGDGQDSIDDYDLAGGGDTLRFGAGIADNEVSAFQYGNSLFLKVNNNGGQVGFIDQFLAGEVVDGDAFDHKLDRVEFANGVVWDRAMIQTMVDRANNNRAPTIASYLPTLQARAGTPFTYTVPVNTITDPDPWDSISYSARMQNGSALPSWLSFDPLTRTFSGTPTASGSLQFLLWGTDNYGYSVGQYVNMTIGTPNRAPTVASPIPDQTAAEGGVFSYTVSAAAFADPDTGDTLTYTASLANGSALPSWLSFNATTRVFSGTPPTGSTGALSIRVTARDTGNLSVSDDFNLTVSVQNLTLNGTTGADTLNGGAGNDTLNGNAGNDTLNGYAGNDTLNGGSGNDTLRGGLGNDTYVVDSTSDVVTENVGEGTDLVQSTVTYTLSANAENLTLTGTSAISGTGNTLDNVLTGNSANNTLTGGDGNDRIDGGTGSDTMVGGNGDDIYTVNVSTDKTTENTNAGMDTVNSSVTLTLATNLENLILTGTSAINGTGNTLANYLRGNGAANTLNGSSGNDLLEGGAGNDKLTDTSGLAYMNGGAGTDTLTGGTGNELLIGGAGNDTITTGNGADILVFNRGDGADTVNGGTGTDNTVSLGGGIRYADLTFAKSSNDLILNVGNSEKLTFKNWYVTTANNKTASKLQLIVEATADYAPGGSNTLTDNKVEQFNFAGLVTQFDAARAANSSLTTWALTNALTGFHLGGSDTAALGGDLAYWYGKNGNLTGMNVAAAHEVINAGLGTTNQTLRAFSGISGGVATLG